MKHLQVKDSLFSVGLIWSFDNHSEHEKGMNYTLLWAGIPGGCGTATGRITCFARRKVYIQQPLLRAGLLKFFVPPARGRSSRWAVAVLQNAPPPSPTAGFSCSSPLFFLFGLAQKEENQRKNRGSLSRILVKARVLTVPSISLAR